MAHIKAVENLDSILSGDGVDGFIVGPHDLSALLGVPGHFEHPAMVEALQTIRRVAENRRAVAGYHVVLPQPETLAHKIREGYLFLAYSVDILFLGETWRKDLQTIKDYIP
jgi:2-dehydro-3-deoxyglucarate aldolase